MSTQPFKKISRKLIVLASFVLLALQVALGSGVAQQPQSASVPSATVVVADGGGSTPPPIHG